MDSKDLLFVGIKSCVLALTRSDGHTLWSVKLPGVLGDSFVTLTSDEKNVYAYSKGRIHCIEILSGTVLWKNELSGFGYGVASISIPGFPSAPDPALCMKLEADGRSRDNAGN